MLFNRQHSKCVSVSGSKKNERIFARQCSKPVKRRQFRLVELPHHHIIHHHVWYKTKAEIKTKLRRENEQMKKRASITTATTNHPAKKKINEQKM